MKQTATKAGPTRGRKKSKDGQKAPGTRRQQRSGDATTRKQEERTDKDGRRKNGGHSMGQHGEKQGGAPSSEQGNQQGESLLEKFFLDQLKDVYYAENKITQALPQMQQAATTEVLQEAFEDHLHQTQRHIKRLEKAFQILGKKPEGKVCEAIEGIVKEVNAIIQETQEGTMTRDAALIIAAQKVEHYEIATYGGLVQLAITLNLDLVAELLDNTLVEEEDTDALLTEIAENEINLGAEHEGNAYSWEQISIIETE